jgi:hypothetical protein
VGPTSDVRCAGPQTGRIDRRPTADRSSRPSSGRRLTAAAPAGGARRQAGPASWLAVVAAQWRAWHPKPRLQPTALMPPPTKKVRVANTVDDDSACAPAAMLPAFKLSYADLTSAQRTAAARLGLDEESWPKWVTPVLLPIEPGEDDDERHQRSYSEWIECVLDDRGLPNEESAEGVVRHTSSTSLLWGELGTEQQAAASSLGYTPELWEAFHPATGYGSLGKHGWCVRECPGNKECWSQDNFARCGHGCEPVRCPNYVLCSHQDDGMIIALKGRCLNCDVTFGENLDVLSPSDGAEDCPICMDEKAAIKLPQCSHRFCGNCVRILYWGKEDSDGYTPPHLHGGTPDDKGCPICRASTLKPAWNRRRRQHA